MQQIIKENVQQIYADARRISYQREPVKPEQLLAVMHIYSRCGAYISIDDNAFGTQIDSAARATGWSHAKIKENFITMFGKQIPTSTFSIDDWQYAKELKFSYFDQKPSSRVLLAFSYGLAQRSASEIIDSNPFIQNQPLLWLGYVKEHCLSLDKQLDLEASELQIIFKSNRIQGPLDLFNRYVGRRLNSKILSHPLARDMHTAWLNLKNTIVEIEFAEAGIEV